MTTAAAAQANGDGLAATVIDRDMFTRRATDLYRILRRPTARKPLSPTTLQRPAASCSVWNRRHMRVGNSIGVSVSDLYEIMSIHDCT